MIIAWVLAGVLADAAQTDVNPINQGSQIVVPVPGAAMSCTKEGDHLVCVLPLEKPLADEAPSAVEAAAKSRPYKPSPPTPALPSPEALAQLKVAAANIELAKSLLPKARTPEEVVLAEQLLYWAKEQYRTIEAQLHTVHGSLHAAADPFDRGSASTTLCQADVNEACAAAMP